MHKSQSKSFEEICPNFYLFRFNSDNIGYIMFNKTDSYYIGVDFGNYQTSKTVLEAIQANVPGNLRYIFSTHSHHDHTGGNPSWKKLLGDTVEIIGGDSPDPNDTIICADRTLKDNETWSLGDVSVTAIHTPGHMKSSYCFNVTMNNNSNKLLFTGDTIFHSGCGKIFNGNHKEFYHSLGKIKALPKEIVVYPGHDYTEDDWIFTSFCNKKNTDKAYLNKLEEIKRRVEEKKNKNLDVIGIFSVGDEGIVNPFFNSDTDFWKEFTKTTNGEECFKVLREIKNKGEYY